MDGAAPNSAKPWPCLFRPSANGRILVLPPRSHAEDHHCPVQLQGEISSCRNIALMRNPPRLILASMVFVECRIAPCRLRRTATNTAAATLDACTMVDHRRRGQNRRRAGDAQCHQTRRRRRQKASLCNYETATLHHGFMVTAGPQGSPTSRPVRQSEMAANIKSSENDAARSQDHHDRAFRPRRCRLSADHRRLYSGLCLYRDLSGHDQSQCRAVAGCRRCHRKIATLAVASLPR